MLVEGQIQDAIEHNALVQKGYNKQYFQDHEEEYRKQIIAEAESWLGTKFHDRAFIKGGGCDCATFIYCVFTNVGVAHEIHVPQYSPQWFLHHTSNLYIDCLKAMGFNQIFTDPKPGDLVIGQVGRAYSHAGIVTDWPMVIHCNPRGLPPSVMYSHADGVPMLSPARPRKFFSIF